MAISTATNKSNAREMYEGRAAYEEEFPKNAIQFHTGYQNSLFGKVDTLGNSIRIQEGYLSFFATKDDKANVSCIHFMADAFADCRNDYDFQVKKNKINLSSEFFTDKLLVYDGWKKQETLYKDRLNLTYQGFVGYASAKGIIKFESFVDLLLDYIRDNELPLTRAGFFESVYNPINTTGLVIDIYKGDAGDDEAREKFVTDPNFGLVSELIAKRGLRFDAQVPWRIIANIQSSNLSKYINPYLKPDYKIQDIFDKFYVKNFEKSTNTIAFDEFKEWLRRFYNSFRIVAPKKSKIVETKCGIKSTFVYSEDINLVPNSKEDDLFFLDIYYQTRLIEAKLDFATAVQEFHRQNYRGLYLFEKDRALAVQQAVEYINYSIGTLAYRSPSVKEINLTRTGIDATM